MKKIDEAIENYFAPEEKKPFGMSDLIEMINEEISVLEPILREAKESPESAAQDDINIKWPVIKITELWGSVNNKDRTIIEQFSKNVKGNSVQEKLASIAEVIQFDPAADIPKILSTIVFLELLRSIVQEYTESVSGFLFEGFLAGIFGGQSIQITDVSGEGAEGQVGKPITDVRLNGREYSLKMLSPKTAIEGSFRNMVNHFKTYNEVVYLTVRKEKGDILDFYEFTVTPQNFVEYIGHARSAKMVPVLKKGQIRGARLANVLDGQIKVGGSKRNIIKVQTPEGKTVAKTSYAARAKKDPEGTYILTYETGEETERIVLSAAAQHLYGDEERWKEIRQLQQGSKEDLIKALMNTPGYERSRQFEIPRGYANKVSENVGSLDLSEQSLRGLAEQYAEKLRNDLIPIYTALNDFTNNINKYFLGVEKGEMTRKQHAMSARGDAQKLSTGTEKIVSKEK